MRPLFALVRKELLQVLRDKIMLVQILVPPIVQLVVMAHAMTFEVKHTRLALVDLDRTPAAHRLVERFTATGRFEVAVATASGAEADRALTERRATLVLGIPEGFERALRRGEPPTVQLVLNAEDGAAAGVVQAYAAQILAAFSRAEAPALAPRARQPGPALTVQTRQRYGHNGAYLPYMAIGLLASLVTIVGVLLTSQNIAREREIGTLEQLNVTPLTRGTFIAGKLLPFWLLGLMELTLGLAVARFGLGVPFAGSVALVYLAALVYLPAALGLGLLISTAAQTQQQAQFLTFFALVTLLFLGGIFTPVLSMPGWAQTLAAANPIQHFAQALRTILLKGGTLPDIARHLAAMAAFAALVLPLAILRYRKTAA